MSSSFNRHRGNAQHNQHRPHNHQNSFVAHRRQRDDVSDVQQLCNPSAQQHPSHQQVSSRVLQRSAPKGHDDYNNRHHHGRKEEDVKPTVRDTGVSSSASSSSHHHHQLVANDDGGGGGGGGGAGGADQSQTRQQHTSQNNITQQQVFSAKRLPFKTDFNDHFETSVEALVDVLPAVTTILTMAEAKQKRAMRTGDGSAAAVPVGFMPALYDPYYCHGTVEKRWKELGVARVINECRDFYQDASVEPFPIDYAILVTNPPFSGDHLPRLFSFLKKSTRPWAVLVPDYVVTKLWFQEVMYGGPVTLASTAVATTKKPSSSNAAAAVATSAAPGGISGAGGGTLSSLFAHHPAFQQQASSSAGQEASSLMSSNSTNNVVKDIVEAEPFFILPNNVYQFDHPIKNGRASSHFRSLWILFAQDKTLEIFRELQCAPTKTNYQLFSSIESLLRHLSKGRDKKRSGFF